MFFRFFFAESEGVSHFWIYFFLNLIILLNFFLVKTGNKSGCGGNGRDIILSFFTVDFLYNKRKGDSGGGVFVELLTFNSRFLDGGELGINIVAKRGDLGSKLSEATLETTGPPPGEFRGGLTDPNNTPAK